MFSVDFLIMFSTPLSERFLTTHRGPDSSWGAQAHCRCCWRCRRLTHKDSWVLGPAVLLQGGRQEAAGGRGEGGGGGRLQVDVGVMESLGRGALVQRPHGTQWPGSAAFSAPTLRLHFEPWPWQSWPRKRPSGQQQQHPARVHARYSFGGELSSLANGRRLIKFINSAQSNAKIKFSIIHGLIFLIQAPMCTEVTSTSGTGHVCGMHNTSVITWAWRCPTPHTY